ncbi:MAG: protoporphyrinogen oxidase [Proteobacteria bacterium]|nr:protoporphyrinogen oxidase [Pseudomonadota bacterium]
MNTPEFDIVIAGAGLSGLSTAHFLKKQAPEAKILILEKTERPGGAIRSMKEQGFLAEWGAHGFLDNVEESRELLNDLGLTERVLKAPLKQFKRYICKNGKLAQIPQSPPTIIKSKLLSFPEKLKVLADLWKKPKSGEQTIAQWASYRFGRAILPFADIALTGTYAGDIETLSIDAAMPGIRDLEKKYGSVFRGAIKSRKNKTSAGMPSMVSFEDGMEFLLKKLASGKVIRYESAIEQIKKTEEGWELEVNGELIQTKQIVLALPINSALKILNGLQKPPQSAVREAVVNNVVLGFDNTADIPFGFGYLAPKIEKRFALGTLFSIHMFPKRAPEGFNLIEILVGGTRNPEHLSLGDEEMIKRAIKDVSKLIKLPAKPVFSQVLRPASGIPQLEIGHLQFLEYREQLQKKFEGLHICGFGWQAIGINDMIKQAKTVANAAFKGKSADQESPRAKPVYF